MTRSQIKYILAVENLKSFGKAADACFVTQSTLSTMVAKFEKQIGIQIFNRKNKPISITPHGEIILKALKSIQREFQLLDERINEVKGIEHGNVSLACIPTVAPFLYPLILNKLSNEFKHVNFSIHELTTEKIITELISGNLDMGIVSTPLDNKNLIEYPLYQEDFLLYDCGSQSHHIQNGTQIDFERLWLLEEGHCLRNQIADICELREHKKINGNLTYNCGTLYTLIEMVKINKGVTLLPRLALMKNKHIKKENIYPLTKPIPVREIGLIIHKNFIKKRILNYLNDLIKDVTSKYINQTPSKKSIVKPF